jgi:hypothetical protein
MIFARGPPDRPKKVMIRHLSDKKAKSRLSCGVPDVADLRADFDRHESRGDSQGAESLIHNAGWGMEASMHGSASFDGFAHAAFGRD